MLDLASRVQDHEKREARRRELDDREREHGGLIPSDRESEAKRRSVAGWGPYRPDVSAAEVVAARAGDLRDPRRVELGRLWSDCGAAVRRFAPRFKRERAETLRNDALLLLIRWPSHGQRSPIDLGGNGGTPRRADWLERVEAGGRAPQFKLTPAAWRALHAAVKQAAESPSARELDLVEERELPSDPLDIAARVEEEQRDRGAATRLPDGAAPEVISEALDVSLDAARAIVSSAYPAASVRDLAESWGISEGAAKNALSRGKRATREAFPELGDLLDALDHGAARWRAATESSAILALIDFRDGLAEESAALDAVREWRGASAGLPMEAQALLAATRAALRRHGNAYGSARAEQIARSVPRLMRAEHRRARRQSVSVSASNAGSRQSASTAPLGRFSAPRAATARQAGNVGAESFPPNQYGDGYSGACSTLYLYRNGARRGPS